MNKTIRTYDDLLEYKRSLQLQLYNQRQLIYEDIDEIREELKPLTQIIRRVSKFFTPGEDNSLLVRGTSTVVDFLVRNVFLKKSGWFTRAIIPFLVQNISSHLVSENKNGLLKKVFSLFSRNGKHKEHD